MGAVLLLLLLPCRCNDFAVLCQVNMVRSEQYYYRTTPYSYHYYYYYYY